MKVSKLATNLIGSEIVKIGNEVNEMKAKGAEIANLTIGDLPNSRTFKRRNPKSLSRKSYKLSTCKWVAISKKSSGK